MERNPISGGRRRRDDADGSAESKRPLAVESLHRRIEALTARLDRIEKKLDEGLIELKALIKFWK